jgi:hypothetical protein
VLIDGGSGVNINTKNLRVQLSLLRPNPTPCNLCMAYQIIAKPLGFIRDLKIFVHGIPYTIIFSIINSSVLDSSYSMLLGRPWLKYEKYPMIWEPI